MEGRRKFAEVSERGSLICFSGASRVITFNCFYKMFMVAYFVLKLNSILISKYNLRIRGELRISILLCKQMRQIISFKTYYLRSPQAFPGRIGRVFFFRFRNISAQRKIPRVPIKINYTGQRKNYRFVKTFWVLKPYLVLVFVLRPQFSYNMTWIISK